MQIFKATIGPTDLYHDKDQPNTQIAFFSPLCFSQYLLKTLLKHYTTPKILTTTQPQNANYHAAIYVKAHFLNAFFYHFLCHALNESSTQICVAEGPPYFKN